MSKTVHLCLVSEQLLPNLIPILMDHPWQVHLAVSQDMTASGQRLARLLEDRGIPAERHEGLPSAGS